ncbi:MAG: sugar phosphate isomerase/epimerase family protein [Planctomycetota bacterium]
MIALSTSILSTDPSQAEQRIRRLLSFDVEGHELSYRIPRSEIEGLGAAIRAARRRVVSLHSYCPVPRGVLPENAGGDLLPLSSLDREERRAAVRATVTTLEWAARLEAGAVVVHCGSTPVEYPRDRVKHLFREGRWRGEEGAQSRRRIAEERLRAAPRSFDALCHSLDRVLREAARLEIPVAPENRLYPHELPDAAEFRLLLEEFRGGPIGSWYDTGHAGYQEALGFQASEELREAMAPGLLGTHVHDVAGIKDHLPPGEGGLDLAALLADLPGEIPLVIECRPDQSDERIAAGIDHLRRLREGEPPPCEPFPILGG